MNKDKIVQNMIEHIKIVEKEHNNQKYVAESSVKKNVVNSILEELERLTKDENQ